MTRAEIVRKFDEIVDFSEIEEFLDTPVKRYSSGMYVRLAFAVAAHLDPEILIVDEVLAVGDAAFQKKCLGKMGSFAQSGRTVLFVSHNMEAVRTLCQRGVWLKDGRLHKDGKAEEIVEAYFNSISSEHSFSCENPDYGLTIQKVVLRNGRGEESSQFQPGDDLIVEITYDAQRRLESPISSSVCWESTAPVLLRICCSMGTARIPRWHREAYLPVQVRASLPTELLGQNVCKVEKRQ